MSGASAAAGPPASPELGRRGGRRRPGRRRPGRRLVAAVAFLLVPVVLALWLLSRGALSSTPIRVVAVGDMACDPADPHFAAGEQGRGNRCRHRGVADLAVAMDPAVFLGLGDYQHEVPTAAAYRDIYHPTYGRLFDRTVPVYGNQEYKVQNGKRFTDYFGDRIGDPKGYWSQNIGRWHLVVLNSNCGAVAGGCGMGSPQQAWLDKDLEDNSRRCVLAAWHHPRWSSGIAGADYQTADLYRTLYEHGVELVLSGHDAHYERFGPLDPNGRADERGIRQYVVGTGGQAHYRPDPHADPAARVGEPASEFVDYDHHGVLELELGSDSWRWRFHALDPGTAVADEGRASCH